MGFKIGDVVEIVSEGYQKELEEQGKKDIGNIGIIDHIDTCWLGIPYLVKVGDSHEYWAYGSELKLDKSNAVKEKQKEITVLKTKLANAEQELKELLEG